VTPTYKAWDSIGDILNYTNYRLEAVIQLLPHQFTSDSLTKLGTIHPILLLDNNDDDNDGNGLPEGLYIPQQLQSLQSLISTTTSTTSGNAMQPGSMRIVDCTSQREQLNWTLHDWQHYWIAKTTDNDEDDKSKNREKKNGMKEEGLCEVEDEVDSAAMVKIKRKGEHPPSLYDQNQQQHHQFSSFSHQSAMHKLLELYIDIREISSLVVGDDSTFHPPRAVEDLDFTTHLSSSSSESPVFLKMSPARCFSDFSLQPCGSCQWIHSLSGSQTFALIPPTPANLSRFIRWASGQRRGSTNSLLAMCEGPAKADVPAGGTLFIPPGWIVASVTTEASTVVVGQYLRSDCIAVHLESLRVEDFLGVHVTKRYPGFRALMWQFAAKLVEALESVVVWGDMTEEEVEARAEGKRKAEEKLRMERKERRLGKQLQQQQELMRHQQQQRAADNALATSTRERGPPHQKHERTKKRKASPGDSFIDSEEEDGVDNNEDSEDGSWGGELSPLYDEDAFINKERGTSVAHNRKGRGVAEVLEEEDGEEEAVLEAGRRARQQPPPAPSRLHSAGKKSKVADWSEDDEEPEDSFDYAYYNNDNDNTGGAAAGLGSPPQTIKLKLKLPTADGGALHQEQHQQRQVQQPISFKIKIKPGSIPQLDGAFDGDNDDGLDLDLVQPTLSLAQDKNKTVLSESDKIAAVALIPILKQWIITTAALEVHNNKVDHQHMYGGLSLLQAQLLPYKLQVLMETAGIHITPPPILLPEIVPREDLSTEDEENEGSGRRVKMRKGEGLLSEGGDAGVSSPVLSPMDIHLASTGDKKGDGNSEDGDEYVPGFSIGGRGGGGGGGGDGEKKKIGGGGMRGRGGGGVKKPGKQLSVKNRLMKKLGMKK